MTPILQSLTQLRGEIVQLKTHRDQLQRSTQSRDEIRSQLVPHLKAESDALRRSIGHKLLGNVGEPLKLRVSPNGFVDVGPVLALLMGVPQVAKALTACLEGYVDADAPTEAQRATELQDVEERLYSLEMAEEAEVCHLEAIGHAVARRGDARPEIVLAVLDEQVHPS